MQPQPVTQKSDLKPTPEQGSLPAGPFLKIAPSHFDQQVSEETMQLIRDEQSGKRSMPEYAQ